MGFSLDLYHKSLYQMRYRIHWSLSFFHGKVNDRNQRENEIFNKNHNCWRLFCTLVWKVYDQLVFLGIEWQQQIFPIKFQYILLFKHHGTVRLVTSLPVTHILKWCFNKGCFMYVSLLLKNWNLSWIYMTCKKNCF